MADLKELVVELDALLVGRPKDADHAARNQAHLLADPVEFALNREYYLSDGGYSRIIFSDLHGTSETGGKLFLTANSREAVKARWEDPDVRAAVARIEELIREAVRAAERGVTQTP